ncbi:MAG: helix-hairpin-helix domain-containing protein [Dysgonamonadaceae bacterium]|nr:helix-hairpin-helix domain-containing protein [Dysgonamonadaceae bacterium]
MWKDFLYFSKREKQGIVILIALVGGIFLGKYLFTPKTAKNQQVAENTDSIAAHNSGATSAGQYTPYQPYTEQKTSESNRPRQSGGKIPETRTYYRQEPENKPVEQYSAPNSAPRQEKLEAGQSLELNLADTAELKKIPGVGSSFARRIAGYRQLLGGYYRKEQLQEVYGMYVELYEKIEPFLRVDESRITKIKVNQASLDRLKAHPYMNFYRAKAIVEMRNKKGKVGNISELSLLEEFPADVLERLSHYFDFE